MPTFLDETLAVVGGVLRKAVADTEAAVSEIQGQVIALTALSDDQRGLLRETMELGGAEAASVLMKRLEDLMRTNAALAEVLMPIIVSLQFQDRLRQELESLERGLALALPRLAGGAAGGGGVPAPGDEAFWTSVAALFTNIASRETVMKAVMGKDYVSREAAVPSGGDDFFL